VFLFKRRRVLLRGHGNQLGIPSGVVFDHGVENHQQLARAGREDDFGLFPLGGQAVGEGSDDRVASSRGERGHVEQATDRRASSPDCPLASELAAVSIEGSQADQGGDLLAIELAQFGDFGDERGAGHRSDAGNALKEVGFVVPVIVGFDEGEDFFFDPFDLLRWSTVCCKLLRTALAVMVSMRFVSVVRKPTSCRRRTTIWASSPCLSEVWAVGRGRK
jgi:hypothetical protein